MGVEQGGKHRAEPGVDIADITGSRLYYIRSNG